MDLEINEVVPIGHPLIEQPPIISFHELVVALKFFVHPARHVKQALGRHSTAVPKTTVHEYRIFVPEVLHHHVCGHISDDIHAEHLSVRAHNYPFR